LAKRVLIHCGRLIDGTGGPVQENVTLHLANDLVERIEPGTISPPPAEAMVIDARRRTVLPGLMDLHVHLVNGVTDPREPHILFGMLQSTTQMLTLWATRNVRLLLEAGFTTIRDVSSFMNPGNPEVLALRDAIQLGLVPGPRIVAGGWISQTAGHRDAFLPRNWVRDPEYLADSPWEVRKLIRRMVRDGVDLIKTSTSGGAGGHGEEIWWRNWTDEELAVLVDESHAYGKRVASHAHSAESVKRAVRAGVDTIEHGISMDDEAIELLAKQGGTLVPTLAARSERAISHRRKSGSPPHVMRKFEAAQAAGTTSFKKAHEAGVVIAMGTDTGRGLREYFGKNAYELTLMVEAGLTPMESLLAATKNAALALGRQDDLGTLQPGKQADLLVVDGNPLDDITVLEDQERIKLVMCGGRVAVDRS